MNLSKKIFIEEGLSGILFILCGVGLQFLEKFPDVIFYSFTILTVVFFITMLVIKVMAKKKKSEPVDELAKLNMLKAESVLYKTIMGLGLGLTFLIHLCFKDKFQIILNWNIFMIIFGCCNLVYCFLFKFFENMGEVLSD